MADEEEVHPDALVTVNVYVPAESPEIVVLVPVPELVEPPGVLVTVQLPVSGNPLNTTLPVATVQVVWVIVPTAGGVGVDGLVLMVTLADEGEVHPEELVTVKEYVPAASPDIVILVPVPEVVVPPGVRVSVQVPDAGKPLNATLPVPTEHVGWMIVPTVGVVGVGLTVIVKVVVVAHSPAVGVKV